MPLFKMSHLHAAHSLYTGVTHSMIFLEAPLVGQKHIDIPCGPFLFNHDAGTASTVFSVGNLTMQYI